MMHSLSLYKIYFFNVHCSLGIETRKVQDILAEMLNGMIYFIIIMLLTRYESSVEYEYV